MKFLAVRAAFESAQAKVPIPPKLTPDSKHEPPLYRPERNRVENNPVKLRPIDRVAARVIAPASWIHKPPQTDYQMSNFTKNPHSKTAIGSVADFEQSFADAKTRRNALGNPIDHVTGKCLSVAEEDLQYCVDECVKRLKSAKDSLQEEYDKAAAAIFGTNRNIDALWEQLHATTAKHAQELRTQRMTVVNESSAIMAGLKDIRQFFLGSDHSLEVARLKEFIGLCEKLRDLKADGTLDAVSDTILSLALGRRSERTQA